MRFSLYVLLAVIGVHSMLAQTPKKWEGSWSGEITTIRNRSYDIVDEKRSIDLTIERSKDHMRVQLKSTVDTNYTKPDGTVTVASTKADTRTKTYSLVYDGRHQRQTEVGEVEISDIKFNKANSVLRIRTELNVERPALPELGKTRIETYYFLMDTESNLWQLSKEEANLPEEEMHKLTTLSKNRMKLKPQDDF